MIVHNNQINAPSFNGNGYVMNQAATTMFGFANSEEEAKLMNLSRGYSQAYIFDLYKPAFYYKQIDINGQVIAFDTYEYNKVIDAAAELGITNAYIQEGETQSESFIPPFDMSGVYRP